jgi:enamine deaminase RidA (YjgF/YER057c/UK114 family)
MARITAGLVLLSVLSLTISLPRPNTEKEPVGTNTVPAGTPYSPGLVVGDTLYISGLQETDPQTHVLPQDFGQEAKDCLTNKC